jgi:hypothetical protein
MLVIATGIGGIFCKARNASSLRAWYMRHLGLTTSSVRCRGGTVDRAGVHVPVQTLVDRLAAGIRSTFPDALAFPKELP